VSYETTRDGVTSWAKYPDEYYDGMSDLGDVNPSCSHHKRQKCIGCGVCTSCDGCYCDEDDY
jgi:hypothetical protein